MYGTSGVIHVWYEMPPPAIPAIQPSSGAGPGAWLSDGAQGGAAGWLGWPGGWPAAAASRSHAVRKPIFKLASGDCTAWLE